MVRFNLPFLVDRGKYDKYLNQIWQDNWHTNNGPLLRELEHELASYLQVDRVIGVANGTLGLQIVLRYLSERTKNREIITTPFSYVATSSSILWQNMTPVFVDIEENTLNIDHKVIEEAITENTAAILATHVFGNPCEVDQLNEIATNHNIPVVYDAAHCFGVEYKGKSIFHYGFASIVSFHATKLFHMVEGGGIISNELRLNEFALKARNFGHDGFHNYSCIGINAKCSEYHAAMGLALLGDIDEIIARRKSQYNLYINKLKWSKKMRQQLINGDCNIYNYSYLPVIFESSNLLERVIGQLEDLNIQTRRYFYPSLNRIDGYPSAEVPISERVAKSILCLPLHHYLEEGDINSVTTAINREIKK